MSSKRPFRPATDAAEVSGLSNDEAIRYHYDNDTEFFALWLDPTLTYSSGRWFRPLSVEPVASTLAEAQAEKHRFHLDALVLKPGARILDIGCGWGSILRRAVDDYAVAHAVGLTLSNDQRDYIAAMGDTRIEARLLDVFKADLDGPYDGIISVGAFEHFADPSMSRARKIEIYQEFFRICHAATAPGSSLSLQSIVWDQVTFQKAKTLIPETVFPNSDIPFIDEIVAGANPCYYLEYVENRREDYVQTLSAWIKNLQDHEAEIVSRWDQVKYDFFAAYLRTSRIGFTRRKNSLARLVFRRRNI